MCTLCTHIEQLLYVDLLFTSEGSIFVIHVSSCVLRVFSSLYKNCIRFFCSLSISSNMVSLTVRHSMIQLGMA